MPAPNVALLSRIVDLIIFIAPIEVAVVDPLEFRTPPPAPPVDVFPKIDELLILVVEFKVLVGIFTTPPPSPPAVLPLTVLSLRVVVAAVVPANVLIPA